MCRKGGINMNKIPTKVNNVIRLSSILLDRNYARNICYTINENTANETDIHVKLELDSNWYRPKKSEKITKRY